MDNIDDMAFDKSLNNPDVCDVYNIMHVQAVVQENQLWSNWVKHM